jgi:drug/metabolite transporter (DMT)-like permease
MQNATTQEQLMRSLPGLALVGISILWGSSWIVSPLLSEVAEPFAATALVLSTAAVILGVACGLLSLKKVPFQSAQSDSTGVHIPHTALLTLLMFILPTLLLAAAQHLGSAGWTPFLYAFLPLLLAFPGGSWQAAMIVAVGAVLVLLNGTVPVAVDRMPAAALALAAVLSQGSALWLSRKWLFGKRMDALLASLIMQLLIAAATLALLSCFFDKLPQVAARALWQPAPLLSICLLGVLGTAVPYAVLYWLLARSTFEPYQLATSQWLQTLVLSAESAWFARIMPPWLAWAAAVVVVAATVLVIRQDPDAQAVPVVFRGSPTG